jgi:hypothetical protein
MLVLVAGRRKVFDRTRGDAMAEWRDVPKAEWRHFFDQMSKLALLGKWAEIEVASPELGDQIIGEKLPVIGVTYDSRDDLVDVALDRANRLIRHPKAIDIEEGPIGIVAIAILDAEGARHMIRLKQPWALPPASAA